MSGELGGGSGEGGRRGAPTGRSVTHALHIPQAGVQPGLGGTIEAGGELLVWLNTTLSHRRALHQAS